MRRLIRDPNFHFRHMHRNPVLFILGCCLMCAVQGCVTQTVSPGETATHPSSAPTISFIAPRTSRPSFIPPSIPPTRPTRTTPGPRTTSTDASTCGLNLIVTVNATRTTYSSGEPVIFTVSAHNNSDSPCTIPTGTCIPQIRITDTADHQIWNRATTQGMCTFGPPQVLQPKRTTTQIVQWDGSQCQGRTPSNCPGTPSPPETYQVSAYWQIQNAAATTFQILP